MTAYELRNINRIIRELPVNDLSAWGICHSCGNHTPTSRLRTVDAGYFNVKICTVCRDKKEG